jgi:hypothetical protein
LAVLGHHRVGKATHVRVSTQQSSSAGFFKGIVGKMCRGEGRSSDNINNVRRREKNYEVIENNKFYTVLTKLEGGKIVKNDITATCY